MEQDTKDEDVDPEVEFLFSCDKKSSNTSKSTIEMVTISDEDDGSDSVSADKDDVNDSADKDDGSDSKEQLNLNMSEKHTNSLLTKHNVVVDNCVAESPNQENINLCTMIDSKGNGNLVVTGSTEIEKAKKLDVNNPTLKITKLSKMKAVSSDYSIDVIPKQSDNINVSKSFENKDYNENKSNSAYHEPINQKVNGQFFSDVLSKASDEFLTQNQLPAKVCKIKHSSKSCSGKKIKSETVVKSEVTELHIKNVTVKEKEVKEKKCRLQNKSCDKKTVPSGTKSVSFETVEENVKSNCRPNLDIKDYCSPVTTESPKSRDVKLLMQNTTNKSSPEILKRNAVANDFCNYVIPKKSKISKVSDATKNLKNKSFDETNSNFLHHKPTKRVEARFFSALLNTATDELLKQKQLSVEICNANNFEENTSSSKKQKIKPACNLKYTKSIAVNKKRELKSRWDDCSIKKYSLFDSEYAEFKNKHEYKEHSFQQNMDKNTDQRSSCEDIFQSLKVNQSFISDNEILKHIKEATYSDFKSKGDSKKEMKYKLENHNVTTAKKEIEKSSFADRSFSGLKNEETSVSKKHHEITNFKKEQIKSTDGINSTAQISDIKYIEIKEKYLQTTSKKINVVVPMQINIERQKAMDAAEALNLHCTSLNIPKAFQKANQQLIADSFCTLSCNRSSEQVITLRHNSTFPSNNTNLKVVPMEIDSGTQDVGQEIICAVSLSPCTSSNVNPVYSGTMAVNYLPSTSVFTEQGDFKHSDRKQYYNLLPCASTALRNEVSVAGGLPQQIPCVVSSFPCTSNVINPIYSENRNSSMHVDRKQIYNLLPVASTAVSCEVSAAGAFLQQMPSICSSFPCTSNVLNHIYCGNAADSCLPSALVQPGDSKQFDNKQDCNSLLSVPGSIQQEISCVDSSFHRTSNIIDSIYPGNAADTCLPSAPALVQPGDANHFDSKQDCNSLPPVSAAISSKVSIAEDLQQNIPFAVSSSCTSSFRNPIHSGNLGINILPSESISIQPDDLKHTDSAKQGCYSLPLVSTATSNDISVESVISQILTWNVQWLKEQSNNSSSPPILVENLKKHSLSFQTMKDYVDFFYPLIILETWHLLHNFWLSLPENLSHKSKTFSFVVGNCVVEDTTMLIDCISIIRSSDLVEFAAPKAGKLLIIELQGSQSVPFKCFGYITNHSFKSITSYSGNLPTVLKDLPAYTYQNALVATFSLKVTEFEFKLDCNNLINAEVVYYISPQLHLIKCLLELSSSPLMTAVLQPRESSYRLISKENVHISSIGPYSTSQKAIIYGVCKTIMTSNGPDIALLQGPAGTGKTHTIIGIIQHLLQYEKKVKILIVAPSDASVDEIGLRLKNVREEFKKCKSRKLQIIRVGSRERIHPEMQCFSLDGMLEKVGYQYKQEVKKYQDTDASAKAKIEDLKTTIEILTQVDSSHPEIHSATTALYSTYEMQKMNDKLLHAARSKFQGFASGDKMFKAKYLRNAEVVLTTLGNCRDSILQLAFESKYGCYFTCCVVDDATQCAEPDILQALTFGIKKLLLVGDKRQLPVTVSSKTAVKFNYHISLPERINSYFLVNGAETPVMMLTEQYRMHSKIYSFPFSEFYYGSSTVNVNIDKTHSSFPINPYSVINTEYCANSNIEYKTVVKLCEYLMSCIEPSNTIGIIIPCYNQKKMFKEIHRSLQCDTIEINVVEAFQGREKDVIILSCIQAYNEKHKSGFLAHKQKLNVALTRAKKCLIICGNTNWLKGDSNWSSLIENAQNRRLCINVSSPDDIVSYVKYIRKPDLLRKDTHS